MKNTPTVLGLLLAGGLVAVVLLGVGCSEERKAPALTKEPKTEAQLATEACYKTAIEEHLQAARAIVAEELGIMKEGGDYSPTIIARRREKEAYCITRVSCFNLPDGGRAALFASCLGEEDGL